MNKINRLFLTAALTVCSFAQEPGVGIPAGGGINLPATAKSKPTPRGTALPGTCEVGEYFFKTDATAGQNTYACTSTNVWTLQGDGGSGGGGGDNISVNGTVASDADFDDTTPAAPANSINVKWQKDTASPNNISASVPYASPLAISGGNLTIANDSLSGTQIDETANFYFTGTLFGAGALTCGAGTAGKALVHTTPLQYCDNAATPTLQYAPYGDSSGNALSGDSATAFFSSGTVEAARLPNLENLNGTLTVGKGGTGATTLSGVLLGNGTSAITATSILGSANGGTGNGFAKLAGPTTSEKTWTGPDANATLLTTNAAVTVAQGGTGTAPGADDQVLVSDSTSAATWKSVGDCTDTGGNHLNYTASTNTFSCGTSSSGSGTAGVLNYQKAGSAAAGDSTDKVIYTYSLPGGTLAAGKCLRLTFSYQHTTGSTNTTFKVFFGSTAVFSHAHASTGLAIWTDIVCNDPGSTTSQQATPGWYQITSTIQSISNPGITTPAENTANAVTIQTTFNVGSGDSITGKMFLVELMP